MNYNGYNRQGGNNGNNNQSGLRVLFPVLFFVAIVIISFVPMLLILVIPAIIIFIIFKAKKTNEQSKPHASSPYYSDSANPLVGQQVLHQPFQQQLQNANPARTQYGNSTASPLNKPALDSHLCNDNEHPDENVSYSETLNDLQPGYTSYSNASPVLNTPFHANAKLTAEDRKKQRNELHDLLDAGIISPDEFRSRIDKL